MISRRSILWVAIVAAIIFWGLESAIHTWIFGEGALLENLLPREANEWWMRSLAALLIVGIGAYAELLHGPRAAMQLRYQGSLIAPALVLATLFWCAEGAIHAWIFHEGGFIENLLPHDANEWWMRVLATVLILAFGLYAEVTRDQLVDAAVKREQLEADLKVAREIQMSMLPKRFHPVPGSERIEIFASLTAAREVGGDFYDYFPLDDGRVCCCIGDVSGKGIPAALFMAIAVTLIRSRASRTLSPATILTEVNAELARNNEACMFVTLFVAIIDFESMEISYANAGHNPPYVIRSERFIERIEDLHGPAVGAVEEFAYGESKLALHPGDSLFLFTDGITEARDQGQNLYGEARLIEMLESMTNVSAESIVKAALDRVQSFETGIAQSDDITAMAVKVAEAA